jgi:LCP family protein required for cell wall assembly
MDIIKKPRQSNKVTNTKSAIPIHNTLNRHVAPNQKPSSVTTPQPKDSMSQNNLPQDELNIENEQVFFSPNDEQTTKKKFGVGCFWVSLIIFIISILISGWLLLSKTSSTIEIMSDGDQKHSLTKTITSLTNSQSYKTLQGFDDGRINILLLGRANTHKSGKDLTDTIMIASIDTKTYKLALLSLPRDLLVTNGSFYTKINALYQIGLHNDEGAKYIIETVEDVIGQDIHYYFVLDFEGFIKIIDILGGINIDVPRHIKDERYPGPGYSYETFEVWPGLQEFDGEKALKYARTRHDDVEGDFGRAKRQQQVMQAARNKAFSLGTIVNPIKINELLTVLGEHVHTNITPNEVEPFIALIKKVDTQNITNVVIDAWKPDSLLISARYYNEHGGISGLVPRIGNYKQIREQAQNIFNLNKISQRKAEIVKEEPTITLINATKNYALTNNLKQTLLSLGFSDISVAKNADKSTEEKTLIIDTTHSTKPFSLDELIKKLPAQKSNQTSSEYDSDFIIILGNDILDSYSYTEISQEELEDDNLKNETN